MRKPRYNAFCGWAEIKCFTGTKREIINRMKKLSPLSYCDTLVVTPEDDINTELFRADSMTFTFFNAAEIDEMFYTHFAEQETEERI